MNFGALPPEVNSARMYAGPGVGSMLVAAAAWDALAAELHFTAASYGSVISGLAGSSWHLAPSVSTMPQTLQGLAQPMPPTPSSGLSSMLVGAGTSAAASGAAGGAAPASARSSLTGRRAGCHQERRGREGQERGPQSRRDPETSQTKSDFPA